MAKKVRTPPPPRRVQAPQKRDTRKPPPVGRGGGGRSPWVYVGIGAAVAALIAAAIVGVVLLRDDGGSGTNTTAARNYNDLPGIRRTEAPWPVDYATLADRLEPLGLTTLSGHNGLVEHYHAHLDIFADGKKVKVPALVGINPGAGYLTELHTHDATGVVHIESQQQGDYTLGQFIAEWGVYLNGRCLGAYCNNLKWYVNGERQTGNPAGLVFKPHQEIALVIGKPPAKIPSSYAFAPGE